MDSKRFTVLDLIDLDLKEHNSLDLHCIAGRRGLTRAIDVPDINRPGLPLTGFFDDFAGRRIQIFGRGEVAYIKKMPEPEVAGAVRKMFEYDIPCCIFSCDMRPQQFFLDEAEKNGCPVLISALNTTDLVIRMLRILSTIFAPKKSVHGVLVEIYGVGVLIMGDSGVGKSETALELIKTGHRLVADDVVEIHCINGNILIGSGANKIIGHHMEIRGVGVINIPYLFGIGAIRDQKKIELVVMLEEWDINKNYDRIGMDEAYIDILGVGVHKFDIPVKPGRNIAIVIETAAMNERLKNMGYNSAKEFNRNILKWIESESAQTVYFGQE